MTASVRVKICGITSLADALGAAEAGADALGFNFYQKSPRYLPLAKAAGIIRKVPPFVARVGVFVNPTQGEVEAALASCRLDWLQMHGDEDLEAMARFPLSMQIKVLRVRGKGDLKHLVPFKGCGAFLLDAFKDGEYGGTGKTFPWEAALEAKKRYGVPVILAGGLTPDNVAAAVKKARPWAVDTASGVESSPGKKDMKKVRQFILEAKAA
ncbi:MAG: phosphoribosylanthranilate isomerase [candidate division FCPU426 bacterium]